jgi:hypothetical protein
VPNFVQMAMDEFWAQIQKLETASTNLKSDLEADRLKLMALWSATKRDPDRSRSAQNQAVLAPAIHNNSALRLRYRDLAAAFNKALGFTREAMVKAGYQPPTNLAGLGAVQLIVPAVAAAALATAFLIYQSIRTATDAQRRATATLAKLVEDPTTSAQERAAAVAALGKSAQPTDLMGQIVPVLAILAALVVLPSVLPKRSTA